MNRHFLNAADCNIIQSSVTFEPSVQTFNSSTPIVEGFPFLDLGEHSLFVSTVDLDNRLRFILPSDKASQLVTTIPRIGNDILGMELAICESCLSKNTARNAYITGRARGHLGGNREFVLGIYHKVDFVTVIELLFPSSIKLGCPSSIRVGYGSLGSIRPRLYLHGRHTL
jgi:hypothetical protein